MRDRTLLGRLVNKETPSGLRPWLRRVAEENLGVSCPEIRITGHVDRIGADLYFCSVESASERVDICIKRFTDVPVSAVEALFERGVRMQPTFDDNRVPATRFLAFNSDLAAIAMSFSDGTSLEARIVASFFSNDAAAECVAAIDRLAIAQSALNAVPIPAGIELAAPCSNEEYVERIDEFLEDRFVVDCLTAHGSNPAALIDSLPKTFRERHERRLLHGDFQAKNALVTADSRVALIDLDYGRGHPLFDIAQFLCQLIRLNRRWRFPRATRLLATYGDRLLDGYGRNGFDYLMEDLPFFMLWSITFSLQSDTEYPALVRAYIRQHLKASPLARRWGLYRTGGAAPLRSPIP